ncbi:hypothetical protein F5X98DRAFT_375936 [Xylaria grammica]|nr:hypothetical protein F5X98DRAFT_375936 [Xylaria grammica]
MIFNRHRRRPRHARQEAIEQLLVELTPLIYKTNKRSNNQDVNTAQRNEQESAPASPDGQPEVSATVIAEPESLDPKALQAAETGADVQSEIFPGDEVQQAPAVKEPTFGTIKMMPIIPRFKEVTGKIPTGQDRSLWRQPRWQTLTNKNHHYDAPQRHKTWSRVASAEVGSFEQVGGEILSAIQAPGPDTTEIEAKLSITSKRDQRRRFEGAYFS